MSQQDSEGRTVLHAITSSVGWHPDVVNGFLNLSTAEDLSRRDFMGRTALHMAASINTSDSAALLWHRLSRGPSSTDKESKVLSTSIQEAFTPSTPRAIESWARNWQSFLEKKEGGRLGAPQPRGMWCNFSARYPPKRRPANQGVSSSKSYSAGG